MGTWGTKLYDMDTTKDVQGDYIHKLKLKKSNQQSYQEMLDSYSSYMGTDEECLFWFALADTQWNYGRLLPEVRDRALHFLEDISALEVTELWREQGEKYERAWEATLEQLREKLHTPQPPEKKVNGYRLFRCKWQVGDVFAYRFTSDHSREKGVYGQYILFQKTGETFWWPGHIIPAVQVFVWMGEEIPDLSQLEKMDILPQNGFPSGLKKYPNKRWDYRVALIATSEKMVPKDHLTFLGNMPQYRPGLPNKPQRTFFVSVAWSGRYNRIFEPYMIRQMFAWKDFDLTTLANYC